MLQLYGTRAQKEAWLAPLMRGEIRSAFLMTEPEVASSDATNIQTRIERHGDHYVLNGRMWWSSGVGDPRCKIAVVMGKTRFDGERFSQQSMLLVPMNSPGLQVVRMLPIFGYDEAPHGHAGVILNDVRVPAENMRMAEPVYQAISALPAAMQTTAIGLSDFGRTGNYFEFCSCWAPPAASG